MDKYAVFGNPISYSKSPLIHQQFAEETQQDMSYEKIEPAPDRFDIALRNFIKAGGKGCNVTLPFKHQAYLLAEEHSSAAKTAQAANTLLVRADGILFADNTDGIGLVQDLTRNLDFSLRQKRILILGAGGAISGVTASLMEQAPAQLMIANRTFHKALHLAELFKLQGDIKAVPFDELDKEGTFDLIIHGTSAHTKGQDLALPPSIIDKHTWCYDLMYGDKDTPFITWAKHHHAKHCADGKGMLVEQAAASFYLWRGVYPSTKPVIAMLNNLTQK